MDFVNEYMLFRFLFDKNPDVRSRFSPALETSAGFSPHVPIRQRLSRDTSSRRYSQFVGSQTHSDESTENESPKRMSLLQSIRYKNRINSVSQESTNSQLTRQRHTALGRTTSCPGGKTLQKNVSQTQFSSIEERQRSATEKEPKLRRSRFQTTLKRTKRILRSASIIGKPRKQSTPTSSNCSSGVQHSTNSPTKPPESQEKASAEAKLEDLVSQSIRRYHSLPNLSLIKLTVDVERPIAIKQDDQQINWPSEQNTEEVLLDFYLPNLVRENSSEETQAIEEVICGDPIMNLNASMMLGLEQSRGEKKQKDESMAGRMEKVDGQMNSYLEDLHQSVHELPEHPEGMNFLARHFFEYQTFNNEPDKGLQMHRPVSASAGADQSASWAPRMISKTGRHLAAPGARANRSTEVKSGHRQSCRLGAKNDYKEWGDRHGDLKPEKIAHKDLWSKFLTGEDTTIRNVFESEFEDKLLQIEPENLAEVVKRSSMKDSDFALTAIERKKSFGCSELLIIMTYAPSVQFVTLTIKKAKKLPFNNYPFARLLVFENRRLIEQKQTTVTPGKHRSSPRKSSTGDAEFSEAFLFPMSPARLGSTHAVVEIWDNPPGGESEKPIVVGHVVVGPSSNGRGILHWHQMIRRPGIPICMWHSLTIKH